MMLHPPKKTILGKSHSCHSSIFTHLSFYNCNIYKPVNQISSGISLSLLFHKGNKHIFHCGGGWLRWRLSSMQWFLGWLATKIAILFGAKVNEVNYVLCLLLAFPLGVVYRWIHSPTVRKLFSVLAGSWLGFSALGWHSLHILVCSFICYLIMWTKSKRQHNYVFLFVFSYLSLGHLYRQWTDYLGWSLDFTLPLMIVTQKVIALSYALYDGTTSPKDHSTDKQRRVTSIQTLPNILEFYAFILFPAGLLVGPYLEFVEWQLHLQNRQCIKDSLRLGLLRLAQGLGCLGLYLMGDKWLPIELLRDEVSQQCVCV